MDNIFYIIQLLITTSWIMILFNSWSIFKSKQIASEYINVTGKHMLPSQSKKYKKELVYFENIISSSTFFWSLIGLLSSNYLFYIAFFLNFGLFKIMIYICKTITKKEYHIVNYFFGIIFILITISITSTILFNKYHFNNNLINLWFQQ